LLDELNSTFEEEQDRVIRKLKARYPDKFTNENANNRDLITERKVLEDE
jgi:ribosomal protein S17E